MGKKDFKKINSSNIVLDVPKKKKKKIKELQRTLEWHADRLGRWTGSQLKNLMTCSASGGKMNWNDFEKVFFIGKSGLKYIYENAMERISGKYVDLGEGTKEMRYGTKVEPLIAKATKKKLKEMNIKGKMKDVGFKTFPTMPFAGVSSDNILLIKKEVVASIEMKACTSWGTHYERTFEFMSDKSNDFWQTQGQMTAWNVNTCYYVVAEPPKNINKYLYYDGDINDLYDDFLKECPISIQIIKSSPTHQAAMLKRICIAETALGKFVKKRGDLNTILQNSIDFYRDNEKKLNKYIPKDVKKAS